MGIDPRGVHQSLVSNVLWNTHSPKLIKVRGFRGFQLRKEGTCRRGCCNRRLLTAVACFCSTHNESVTALSIVHSLEPNHPCGLLFFNFTTVTTPSLKARVLLYRTPPRWSAEAAFCNATGNAALSKSVAVYCSIQQSTHDFDFNIESEPASPFDWWVQHLGSSSNQCVNSLKAFIFKHS